MSAPSCAAALLAGGGSLRMGRPKAELEVGGVSLGQRAAATLRALSADVVQAGGDAIAGVELLRLTDRLPGCGPMVGIEAALARVEIPLAVLAVDLPFVPTALLQEALRIVEGGAQVCAPHWNDRWHPLCATYSPSLLPHITARLDAGNYGMQNLLEEFGTALPNETLRSFGDPPKTLFNINSPEDLETARRIGQ